MRTALKVLTSLVVIYPMTGFATEIEPGEEIIMKVRGILTIPPPAKSPARGDEGEGPFERLIILNGNMIDGTGAPLQGPTTIVVEGNHIVDIKMGGGMPDVATLDEAQVKIIDASGQYVLPGFINSHAHFGTPTHAFAGSFTNPEYVSKLWLAHGITTVRDVGSLMGLSWTLDHKDRSARGDITAPRIRAYALFPQVMESPEAARQWVRAVDRKGADGVKFTGAAPKLIEAAVAEAQKLGLKTAYHHAQISVTQMNVLDSARLGVDSMEHWYGLPEAMFEGRIVQDYPYAYNYNNEQDRFGEAGNLWRQAAAPGSERWRATIQVLRDLDFTLDPTFTVYEANRDVMRARQAEWHAAYSMPYITRAFESNPRIHGSYFFDWTTAHEVVWKRNFDRWMAFVNDYKNAGGRVTVGSDAGFIYKLYGFAYIRELELLQEAGFHPLEVVQAATIKGAELLGLDAEIGSIEIGKKADLIIVRENPLVNFKVLYGTGHRWYNKAADRMEQTKGILYTIKDGTLFDAQKLLADIRQLVAKKKAEEMNTSP
ncbi:amidohydrolase family protein [Paremcibacter congregatus]|uniref:Amidohydrolase n=1 Tax=Paremcibacter congregatus TaxID=2043170 RepID=A0A2G4YQY3_9PROT|nr:amidohydrolase family protein [Paremcibacter congregatus]PHZ84731.1 amidohydrolase [Paremcibacter congregatus]QDE28925.1 amidohydrolase family protein [Paremcibacter congregatus]